MVDGQLRFAPRADDLADANTQIDPQAIFDYLYFHVIPSPRTIYKGIYRLPPGHTASLHNGQVKVERNWVTFPLLTPTQSKAWLKESRQNFDDVVLDPWA